MTESKKGLQTMTVHEILKKFLKDNGFDGLCYEDWADDTGWAGSHRFKNNNPVIKLAKNPGDVNLTLWHEVVHAMLFQMGSKLFNDEEFVEAMAGLLNHFVRNSPYDLREDIKKETP